MSVKLNKMASNLTKKNMLELENKQKQLREMEKIYYEIRSKHSSKQSKSREKQSSKPVLRPDKTLYYMHKEGADLKHKIG